MPEVPKVATPTTASALTSVVASVYNALEGSNPSGAALAILLGLWDLETGTGRGTWNWNVGNLKSAACGNPNTTQTFYVISSIEKECNKFQAFDSLESGVMSWLSLLAKTPRYAASWAAVKLGDAVGFAQAISVSGYQYLGKDTAKAKQIAETYAKGVLGRIQKYLKVLPTPSASQAMGAGLLLVLGVLGFGAWWVWKRPARKEISS
jgi:hypothetical protein